MAGRDGTYKRTWTWSERFEAAQIAYSNGYRPPKVLDPIRIGPKLLFESAEDVQKLLCLDYLPETFQSETIPFGENEGTSVSFHIIGHCMKLQHSDRNFWS
ncbi:hypothetical protein CMQ_4063 [Grosmannia clavigera kw1407]|uniref:Uncharacterized protein n=1 Tax=Grosmannia clavigera (strain kw1407 / UAMH 11150) TaxID=655863 RepID=F0X822_GROCL|nr:uncharacterized protein CMQ_4063 [Grosmannia clavigera kw1407]EFX05994.1 hypothetical protein CMQ_4063 [Grosmannia clavigera kw1407]